MTNKVFVFNIVIVGMPSRIREYLFVLLMLSTNYCEINDHTICCVSKLE